MEAATTGMTSDDPGEQAALRPAPPKVELEEMIKLLADEAGHNEIMADFLRGRPNCDHRPAERKALVFDRAMKTLELVQLYQDGFLALIKAERAKAKKSSSGRR